MLDENGQPVTTDSYKELVKQRDKLIEEESIDKISFWFGLIFHKTYPVLLIFYTH